MRKHFLIALIILPMLSFSQYSISGKVTDKQSNDHLTGAHIILKGTNITTLSGLNGVYEFTNLKAGSYEFEISYIGFQTLSKTIELNKDLNLNFEMEYRAYLADEVIISAVKVPLNSPTSFNNITKAEIQNQNLGQDIPYLLRNLPSLVVTSDAGAGVGYTGLRIRGSDMTRINITLNGIPYNDPESQGVFWVNMPDFTSSIESIQVQRGVGTSTNGAAAFGASINIETLNMNADAYGELNSSAGSFNTFKNSVSFGTGLLNGKFTIDGRLSKITSDGYIDRAYADLKSYYLSAAYYGKNTIIKFINFSGKEKTYQAWYGVPKSMLATNRTFNPYTYENETDNYQQDNYQLLFSQKINTNLHLNTALHYTKGRGYYEQYKEGRSFADYLLNDVNIGDITITETDLIQQKWLDNDFYGLTYSLKYNKSGIRAVLGGGWNRYDGGHFGEVIWAQYASDGALKHRWYDNTGIKKDFNIYAKVNYTLSDLSIYGDVQYRNVNYSINGTHDDLRDISQSHNFDFFNPKFGLYYKLNQSADIFASVAISNREPNRSNYRDADNSNTPMAEKLIDYEFGYKFKSTTYAFELNAFYMDYKDQLVLTGEINNVGAAIMTNVPESYRLGLEFNGGIQLTDNLKWNINASLSKNKIKNFTAYVDNWSPPYEQIEDVIGDTDLSFSPSFIAGSNFELEAIKDLKISINSKYVSRQYIDNSANVDRSIDPYFVTDLNINYRFTTSLFKEIIVKLMVNNIFDNEYETNAWVYRYYSNGVEDVMDGYFPQAGTNFMLGLTLKF